MAREECATSERRQTRYPEMGVSDLAALYLSHQDSESVSQSRFDQSNPMCVCRPRVCVSVVTRRPEEREDTNGYGNVFYICLVKK